jgi:hypothetical protein
VQGLESDFTKGLGATPTSMPSTTYGDYIDTAAIAIPNSLDDNTSIEPWPIEQSTGVFSGWNSFELSYPNNWA